MFQQIFETIKIIVMY